MAKLNKQHQKKVADANADGFEPIPAGAYHVRLADVDPDREGPKGPYWSWEYDVVEEPHVNRKLWDNTSLSENAAFRFKQVFQAFGVPEDTDTDDLVGQVVKAIVSIRTIQEGDRKGQLANQIDRFAPADDDFEVPEAANVGGSPGGEDIFD